MKNFMVILFIMSIVSNVFAGDRFIRNNEKEVVIDTKTNLMWQDNGDAKTIEKTWQEAIDYCENLTLAGYDDWYLPNINQLYSIVDISRVPTIDPTFKNVVSEFYYSSTNIILADGFSYAWFVSFGGGNGDGCNKSYSYYVRCVRDND